MSTTCDACGKTVDGEPESGWHHFGSYHSDWGNDSIESHEEWDVCSFECYLRIVRRCVEDYGERTHEATLVVDYKDFEFIETMLACEPTGSNTSPSASGSSEK